MVRCWSIPSKSDLGMRKRSSAILSHDHTNLGTHLHDVVHQCTGFSDRGPRHLHLPIEAAGSCDDNPLPHENRHNYDRPRPCRNNNQFSDYWFVSVRWFCYVLFRNLCIYHPNSVTWSRLSPQIQFLPVLSQRDDTLVGSDQKSRRGEMPRSRVDRLL